MITILTLLPALLLLFGRWIFWPRKPEFDGDDHVMSGTWSKVGRVIEKNPRRAWIISGTFLLLLASAAPTLKADGIGTIDTFTGNPESVVGQKLLETHFPGGQGDPTQIVVAADKIESLTVYPNPSEDTLFFSAEVSGANVSIINSEGGATVSTQKANENSINVSGLKSGIYLILVEKDGIKTVRRFIKK